MNSNIYMSRARFYDLDLSPLKCLYSAVFTESEFRNVTFKDNTGHFADFSLSLIKDCTFESVKFNNAFLVGANISNTTYNRSDLRDARAIYIFCESCLFVDCDLSGIRFEAASFNDVVFDRCNLFNANFRAAGLRAVTFKGCNLEFADFRGAEYGDCIEASNCVLSKVRFGEEIPYWAQKCVVNL
ncbi:MAG: hypothetical protein KatS3mg087_1336 [Patescibacteria group bacterium]|nr:MAG: hypothetical protein KatS3mg087_1336 [Patescibacteria group bacterium]